jgi:hypothetical protein
MAEMNPHSITHSSNLKPNGAELSGKVCYVKNDYQQLVNDPPLLIKKTV